MWSWRRDVLVSIDERQGSVENVLKKEITGVVFFEHGVCKRERKREREKLSCCQFIINYFCPEATAVHDVFR